GKNQGHVRPGRKAQDEAGGNEGCEDLGGHGPSSEVYRGGKEAAPGSLHTDWGARPHLPPGVARRDGGGRTRPMRVFPCRACPPREDARASAGKPERLWSSNRSRFLSEFKGRTPARIARSRPCQWLNLARAARVVLLVWAGRLVEHDGKRIGELPRADRGSGERRHIGAAPPRAGVHDQPVGRNSRLPAWQCSRLAAPAPQLMPPCAAPVCIAPALCARQLCSNR